MTINAQFESEIVGVLSEIAALLDQDSFRAKMALELADVVTSRPTEIGTRYCSNDWWGGSGSMADYIPDDQGVRSPYARLLIRLIRAFEAAGFECPRAASWADVFEGWLNSGIISND